MTLSSCGKLQFPPKLHEDIICVDFVQENDRGELVILKCRCFAFDLDKNERIGESYDESPRVCSQMPQFQDFPKLRGFLKDYRIFRDDLKEKASKIKRKRIRKKLLKSLN